MAKIGAFEMHADRYEEWFEHNPFAWQSELAAVRKALPFRGKGVEIGVGSGRFARPLGIRHGVEPSGRMREIARGLGIDAVDGTAERLPYPDSSFDFALMVTTVCFLDDVNRSFREIHRILKKRGSFVVGFVDRESALGARYQEKKSQSLFYREAVFYSGAEIESFMRAAGFQKISFYQTIFRPLDELFRPDPVKRGRGEGSFLVARGSK